jgi:hypothetical protein
MSSVSWNLHPFKADFIFGNSQKSFRAKSGEEGGCSILVIDFWARNCLTESTFFYALLHVTALIFPHNRLGWLFGLEEQFKVILKNMMSIVFICDLDMWVFLGCGNVGCLHCKLCCLLSGTYWKHHASSPVTITDKKLFGTWLEWLEHTSMCCWFCHSFLRPDVETHAPYQCHNLRLALMCWNHNWCKMNATSATSATSVGGRIRFFSICQHTVATVRGLFFHLSSSGILYESDCLCTTSNDKIVHSWPWHGQTFGTRNTI